MAEILLKGIKQVFAETYNNTAVDDKKGYLGLSGMIVAVQVAISILEHVIIRISMKAIVRKLQRLHSL